MNENVIVCDNCHCITTIELKRKVANIEGKGIEVAWFNCRNCGKPYLIEVVDYTVEKKRKKLVKINKSIQKKKQRGILPAEERIKQAIKLKDDLISYEMKLKDKYKGLIPRNILV
nr:MAG TPA: DNA-directed RNA polymerase [Caudoviricetes sp.]